MFDWDTLLSFDGNTAPYLQNAYVRIQSIFRRGEIDLAKYGRLLGSEQVQSGETFPKVIITEAIEHELAIQLLEFHEVVARAVEDLMIHKICTYLHHLAVLFHRFYEHCKILNAPDEATKDSRIIICVLVAATLKKGLDLLGVEVLEKM